MDQHQETQADGGSGPGGEKPDVTDQHRESARQMTREYVEDRPTTTLPGSGGTVSGTAVSDWVDEKDKGHVETSVEEGDVQYRKTEEFHDKIDG
ncbi:MAG: hypothetical protein AB7G47_00535 [Mycolicibacterium sp.]|uniref:hypothetical protein n=1 Tax=Mycolicibacterium sp. TaxID=2320850 RepID=UPI003D0CB7C1